MADAAHHLPAALTFFGEAEATTVEAITARIIPSDEHAPGAREAEAVTYIDRALSGFSKGLQIVYRRALVALDARSRALHGVPFVGLDEATQDALLVEIEAGARDDVEDAALLGRFFAVVREHTIEGTFGDPAYGGNRDAVGWKLIGFPGAQWGYSPEQMSPGFDAASIPVVTLADLRRQRVAIADRSAGHQA